MNNISSVCWDITSKCNENCGYCYRNQNNKELDYESNRIILKKLIDFGVKKISFVGGEPLLYTSLFDLIAWAKIYSGGKTIFSITTNAILLAPNVNGEIKINEELITKVVDSFDWISFSLDASNKEDQILMGRNELHFDRIISMLRHLSYKHCEKKIKINTVLSKINLNKITQIYDILQKYNVKRWKIMRFLASRENALHNKDKYYISEKEFNEEINKILLYGSNFIQISINGYDYYDNSYITISSDGKLVVFDGNHYISRVNLLTEEIGKILDFVDLDGNKKKRSDFLKV